MKEGARILGIDDAAFEFEDEETFLTGVVYRGTEFIEDIVTTEIEVDGDEATEKIMELFRSCKNTAQVKAVLLDGISFAGFNIVDIEEVSREIERPVIVVTSNQPDREDFRETMERTDNYDETFEDFSEAQEVELKDGISYIQFAGTDLEEAEDIVRSSMIHGLTPEPIRVAHMIGRSLRDTY